MTGPRLCPTSFGMTPREREVMDLFDAGVDRPQIAERTGMAIGTVIGIVARYGPGDDRLAREAATRGATMRLGAAVEAYQRRRTAPQSRGGHET